MSIKTDQQVALHPRQWESPDVRKREKTHHIETFPFKYTLIYQKCRCVGIFVLILICHFYLLQIAEEKTHKMYSIVFDFLTKTAKKNS